MGSGIYFQCRRCGFELSVHEGVGFRDPYVQEELKAQCLEGEFGKEVQLIVKQHQACVIDSGLVLYRCRTCGHFMNVPRLNVSFKDDSWDPTSVKGQSRQLKDGSWVYYYQHRCDHCGGRMMKVDPSELTVCPHCGDKEHWNGDLICWD